MELENKTAIITGSGRGIGEGIAIAFAREGANVVVMDRGISGDAENVAKIIMAAGGRAIAVQADVTDKQSLQQMVDRTIEEFGGLDVLVNNAGIESTPVMVKDIPESQWDRVLGVNLKGVFLCCQAVLPMMMAQRSGRIINISSLAGRRMSFFGSADYTASKHGVMGLTNHLAWEVADFGITVNAICPGAVITPLAEEGTTPEYRDFVTTRLIPMGRWCTADDIAQGAIFFASDRAAMVTGQAMDIDGGAMTGYGEDLRPIIRQRMEELQAAAARKH
jgi:NAD(P)-dependent dehydrogenase (short-subunit alcohol dehydrogenase family)